MVAVICNVAVLTMPTEWIAAAVVIGALVGMIVRGQHWIRRHLTTDGRLIGSRLRQAEDARIRTEITEAAREAIRQRGEVERRLFTLVKKGA